MPEMDLKLEPFSGKGRQGKLPSDDGKNEQKKMSFILFGMCNLEPY